MKPPIDVSTRVSGDLSAIMDALINDPDREEPPTLADVASLLRHRSSRAEVREILLHPQRHESLLAEVGR